MRLEVRAPQSIAIVLVLVLSAVSGTFGAAVSTASSPVSTPTLTPDEANYIGVLAGAIKFPAAQLGPFEQWLLGLSPAQKALLTETAAEMKATAHGPSDRTVKALNLQPMASISWTCFGATLIAGGVIGGVVGNAPGAIIGLAAGGIAGFYACQQGDINVGALYPPWAQGVAGAFGNEVNITATEFTNIISALNVSEVAWQRAADNAALLQLNRSIFSIPEDLVRSNIADQISQVGDAYAQQSSSAFNVLMNELQGNGGTGAIYASVAPGACFSGTLGGCASGTTYSPPWTTVAPIAYGAALAIGAGTIDAYIAHGSTIFATEGTQAAGDTVTIHNAFSKTQWYNWTVPAASYASEVFPGPSALYRISHTTSTTTEWLAHGQQIPATWSNGIGFGTGTNSVPWQEGLYTSPGGIGSYGVALTESVPSWARESAFYLTDPGSVGINLNTWLSNIESNAFTNAQAYWNFLRAAGFTNASQIPPNCIVPAPYMILPSALNTTSLNASQWESLYLGLLVGMGHFYNVSLNTTSFCGNRAIRQWNIGGAWWGNLAVNATGSIFLANATTPIDQYGKALASEKFWNVSTWAVKNDQFFIMPTIGSVKIPVGVRWAVPANNPIEVFAIKAGNTLWLTGNGTGSGTSCGGGVGNSTTPPFCAAVRPLVSLSAGDSIYLTSCIVGGTAQTSCTVTVQTLNTTVANITCSGPCAQAAPPGAFAWPSLLQGLSNFVCWITGGLVCGSLANAVATAITLILIVLLVVLAIWAVGTALKRRGGSAPGTSVFVARER